MSEILDLDALAPEVKKVKINGKLVDLHPPKLKNIIEMQKLFTAFQVVGDDPEDQAGSLSKLEEVLAPIIPAIKEDKTIDFSIEQLYAVLQFAMSTVEPKELEKVKAVTSKKKGEDATPQEPSPTS